jgi:DNA repair protein RadC
VGNSGDTILNWDALNEDEKIELSMVSSEFPCGLEPSAMDEEITRQLKAAGTVLDITMLDHIIFNRTGYYSFLENGKL